MPMSSDTAPSYSLHTQKGSLLTSAFPRLHISATLSRFDLSLVESLRRSGFLETVGTQG